MNFIIYTRCSTEDQKKGFSHDYQVNGLLSSPICKGGRHIATFQDTATGTNFDREQLDKAYNFCKSKRGIISKILVYKWDRFGRNVGEAFQMIKKFKEIGVEVNCPDFDIDFTDSNWPIMLSVTLGMAQSESLKISDRTKDGMYTSYKMGYYPASPPIGYLRDWVGNRASLTPDPDKSGLVKSIFERVAQGETAIDLYRKHQDQLQIKKNAFYHMLKNETYTGHLIIKPYKSQLACRVKAKFPALISDDLYYKVQSILEKRKPIYNTIDQELSFFYAKGIITSPSGNMMTAYFAKSKSGRKFPYYEDKTCKGSIINADRTHQVILSIIQEINLEIPLSKIAIAREIFYADADEYKTQIIKSKALIDQKKLMLKKIELDYLNSSLTADQYSKLYERLESEIQSLDTDLFNLNLKIQNLDTQFKDFFEHLTNLHKLFTSSTNYNKNRLLKAIFPQGFTITKPDYSFRTPQFNMIIDLMCSKSTLIDQIKKDSASYYDESLSEGGTPNPLRTLKTLPTPQNLQIHIELLISSIA
jgi:DNA invertase Pin-like site-specific DNA recombinase